MREIVLKEAGEERAAAAVYEDITKALIKSGKTITTMESCTAGLLISLLTDTEGASAVVPGGYVTYGNAAKIKAGVPAEIIEKYGVYSEETARAMAAACREKQGTDYAVGITGTFGNPDPANGDSVCGEVYCVILGSKEVSLKLYLPSCGNRRSYKYTTALAVGTALREYLA